MATPTTPTADQLAEDLEWAMEVIRDDLGHEAVGSPRFLTASGHLAAYQESQPCCAGGGATCDHAVEARQ